MKFRTIFFLGILFSYIGNAQNTSPTVFILDASGSMWQKINGEYKIHMAQKVLSEYVNKLKVNEPIGLVAYGHRHVSECSDIEILLPFTNTDHEGFKNSIKAINPKGKTPLARSARLVFDQLVTTLTKATVILITDGLETCDGDLCDVVASYKSRGVDFVLHVVGFGLMNEDKSLLECAALTGGGNYIDAENADQLSEAIDRSVALPVGVPSANLAIKTVVNGSLADAMIKVFPSGQNIEIAAVRTYNHKNKNPAFVMLPKGTYDFTAELIRGRGTEAVNLLSRSVKADVDTILMDFTTGFISVNITANGELHDAGISLTPINENKVVASGRSYNSSSSNPKKMEMSPGIYTMTLKSIKIEGSGKEYMMDSIIIEPGKTTSVSHEFDYGLISVGAQANEKLTDAIVNITPEGQQRPVASGRTYVSESTNPKMFILSPGEYIIEVKLIKPEYGGPKTIKVKVEKGAEITEIVKW